jgi:hypothetical protein
VSAMAKRREKRWRGALTRGGGEGGGAMACSDTRGRK